MEVLPGVGPARAARLATLGIERVADLLAHSPRAYEDRGDWIPISAVAGREPGTWVAVRGRVRSRSIRRAGGRVTLRAVLEDESGRVPVLWFHAGFLAGTVATGVALALSGRVSRDGAILQPELAVLDDPGDAGPDRLVGIRPLYPLTEGVTQRLLRDLCGTCIDRVDPGPDPLPDDLRREAGLPERRDALRWAHRPRTMAEAERGRERLLFDELLPIEIALHRRLDARRRRRAPVARPSGDGAGRFVAGLPFTLSPSQRAAVDDALDDLDAGRPMGRMLCGEVGAGKTAVALAVAEEARSRGLQVAFLAPTDLLARQHHRTAVALLPRGETGVVRLTGSMPAADAASARRALASGEADLAIGTHALLSDATRFARLGLVVIDEQHRFGVEQREALLAKGRTPHVLALTATPIPRSLALLAFGDCDLSRLDPRPDARGEVTTRVVPRTKRQASLRWLRERLDRGEQAFLVRPRVAGDEAGAVELRDELVGGTLRGLEVGLVHGRLPADARDAVLARFAAGDLSALVATTVVEVGLDVPGATILWVEGAERLGLAQLHQLRGRISRRGQRGYCWLVEGRDAPEGSRERLAALEQVDDGLRLAEIDLAARGPGELLGLRQSGHAGLFAGLGADAPKRLADLAERAWRVAGQLVAREAAGLRDAPGEEDPCREDPSAGAPRASCS